MSNSKKISFNIILQKRVKFINLLLFQMKFPNQSRPVSNKIDLLMRESCLLNNHHYSDTLQGSNTPSTDRSRSRSGTPRTNPSSPIITPSSPTIPSSPTFPIHRDTTYNIEQQRPGDLINKPETVFCLLLIYLLYYFVEWASELLENARPLVLQFGATLSQLHPFDLIPTLAVQRTGVTFGDQFGNFVQVSPENNSEQILRAYQSHSLPLTFPPGNASDPNNELILNYEYRTKITELNLPKLTQPKIDLARRIYNSIKDDVPELESDRQSQEIYQLQQRVKSIEDGEPKAKQILPSDLALPSDIVLDVTSMSQSQSQSQTLFNFDFSHISNLDEQEKEKMISSTVAAYGDFVVKSARSFFTAEVSINSQKPGSGFCILSFHMTFHIHLSFSPLKIWHGKISYFSCCVSISA